VFLGENLRMPYPRKFVHKRMKFKVLFATLFLKKDFASLMMIDGVLFGKNRGD